MMAETYIVDPAGIIPIRSRDFSPVSRTEVLPPNPEDSIVTKKERP